MFPLNPQFAIQLARVPLIAALAALAACSPESDVSTAHAVVPPVIRADDDNFAQIALEDGTVTLVDFWAPWCGPCKLMTPEINAVAQQFEGRATVAKLDVDENPKIAKEYDVHGLPTLLVFKDGVEVSRRLGYTDRRGLALLIEKHLADPAGSELP